MQKRAAIRAVLLVRLFGMKRYLKLQDEKVEGSEEK